jgi:hypothetical protein
MGRATRQLIVWTCWLCGAPHLEITALLSGSRRRESGGFSPVEDGLSLRVPRVAS